jgi:hypothetical protein
MRCRGLGWPCDCLTPIASEQFFSHIMTWTGYISMKWWWWCLLCTRQILLSSVFFIVLAQWNNIPRVDNLLHSDTLWNILISSQLVFIITIQCCVLNSREATYKHVIVVGLTRPGFELIYHTRGKHAYTPTRYQLFCCTTSLI